MVRKGDVVLAMSSGSARVVGKTAQVRSNWYGAFGAFCAVLRPSAAVDPWYFGAFFQTQEYRKTISAASAGININNLRREHLLSLPFPLPPRSEQLRIVARLEALLHEARRTREALQRIPPLVKRFRQSVLAAAFRGQLVPQDPRDEPAAALLERIRAERRQRWVAQGKDLARYVEPSALDAVGLGELPAGWVWTTVGEVTQNHDGRRIPVKDSDRKSRQGRYPYYGASGIIDHVDDFLFDGDYLLFAEDGANILSRSSPRAFQAHGKFWVNNHAHVLTTESQIPLAYLQHLLNLSDLAPYTTGTAQPKVTQANMNRIPVPLAQLAAQRRIVARIEALFAQADAVEAAVARGLRRLEQFERSVLARAFRGELV